MCKPINANKTLLSFFHFFMDIRHLIKNLTYSTHYKEFIRVFTPENGKTFYLYFPFLLPLPILPSFFSFSASSFFGTLQHLTHPPAKSATLPLNKMPIFEGAEPWHINFTLSCFISLWNSAPAHLLSGKELRPSSQEYVRFSGRSSRHNVFILSCVGSL